MTQETHGTACAGLAVADENNGVCGVGVAFNAQVAAIRLVGSGATTTDIARVIIFNSGFLVKFFVVIYSVYCEHKCWDFN